MKKLDRSIPIDAITAGTLFKEFVHGAYFGTGIEKPRVGITTFANSIEYKILNWGQYREHEKELNGFRISLAIALEMYAGKKQYNLIKEKLFRLCDSAKSARSFDKLIEIMLTGRELMGK
jgi:hypothetical protein